MNGPTGQPPTPNGRGRDPLATVQANAEALEWYVATIDVTPPADLSARVLSRVARERRRTPPGRLLAALASLSPTRIRSAFARNLDAAAGRMATAPLVRAQAIALVAVLVFSVGALGTAGALVIRDTIDQRPAPPSVAAPSVAPRPTPPPTAKPTPSPTPTATDATARPTNEPTTRVVPFGPEVPSTTDVPSTAAPAGNGNPRRTERPQPNTGAERTPKPHPTPKAERTKKPHPTPKRTKKPRPTHKADRTPKPGTGAARTPGAGGPPD